MWRGTVLPRYVDEFIGECTQLWSFSAERCCAREAYDEQENDGLRRWGARAELTGDTCTHLMTHPRESRLN